MVKMLKIAEMLEKCEGRVITLYVFIAFLQSPVVQTSQVGLFAMETSTGQLDTNDVTMTFRSKLYCADYCDRSDKCVLFSAMKSLPQAHAIDVTWQCNFSVVGSWTVEPNGNKAIYRHQSRREFMH